MTTTARIVGPDPNKTVMGSDLQAITGLLNGDAGWERPVKTLAGLTVASGMSATGGATISGGAVINGGGAVNGLLSANNGLGVSGGASIAGGLGVSGGAAIAGGLTQTTGATSLTGTTFAATYAGAWTATATGFTFTGPETVVGNVTIGNSVPTTLASFVVTAGAQTVTLGAAATPGLYHDVANGRTLIGTATPLTSANDDRLSVVGGVSYFVGASGPSIGIRYVSTDTAGWTIVKDGAGANKDLLFQDDGGVEIVRIGDVGSTAQFRVSGAAAVTGALTVANSITVTSGGAAITGAISGTSGLHITAGSSAFDAAVSISTGGLAVLSGGFDVNVGLLSAAAGKIGFFSATTAAKQTVAGVRTGTLAQLQAVMLSLLTALSTYGLVSDTTT